MMTEIEGRTYYYKEVEESASRLADLLEELNTYFDSAALNDLIDLLSDIPWNRLSTKYSGIEKENLTDDQKEEIALCRKDWQNELEDWRAEITPYLTNIKAFYEAFYALNQIRVVALTRALRYDYGAVKELCNEMQPLMLTSRELYHALTFLEIDQIRTLLSDQTPTVFNRMLSAFQNGEEDFVRLMYDMEYAPMVGLRDILMVELEKVESFSDFSKDQAKSDEELRSLVVEELCEMNNCNLGDITISNGADFTIETLQNQQKLLSDLFLNQTYCLYHSSISTQSDRQKILNVYEEWRKYNPSCTPLDECELTNYSDRLDRVIMAQIDKWIFSVIHSHMNQESAQIEGTDAKTSHSTSAVDYRIFFASQTRDIEYKSMRVIAARLAGKEIVGNGIVQSQLAYIQVSDIPRFCYFFLHKICPPDNITNVDFSKPILWLGSWESLKYLVYRLYGKPKSLPSNIGKEITEAFRFKRMRQPKNNEGKITFKTFNNTSNYINKVDYEEIKRIDNIIKEFEPFMKRQN